MRQQGTMRQNGRGSAHTENGHAVPHDSSRAVELKRALDVTVAAAALLVLSPLIVLVALAVKLESRGPAFFRCRRVGRGGSTLSMLKFRKMRDGVGGPALTAVRDDRFTRIGGFLAETKLDELPQLWNVLRGQMSLVGPRPEDLSIVELQPGEYAHILRVRPGITGLSQLAFANEAEILAEHDRLGDYVNRILPEKMRLDRLYVERHSLRMDLQIIAWTVAAVVLRKRPAVHRATGRLTMRTPRDLEMAPVSFNSASVSVKTTQSA
jgi:lipopolysaccharide/colanic/teichoic acid biosynthesis glycosyltransferase